jgi:hypothetical protein
MLLLAAIVTVMASTQSTHFEEHTLASDLKGGYQVVACDVNGDGKLDLIALASDMPDLVWFENPTWERHVLARNLPSMINLACWNATPRSTPQMVVTYEFSMNPRESAGIVSMLTPDGDSRRPWKVKEIDRLPSSHRLRWADIDGNGKKVVINAPLAAADAQGPDYRGHVPLVYYVPGEWKRRLIGDDEQGVVHGIFITDWDRDGRDDVLIGSFVGIHLYRFRDGKWSRTAIAKGSPKPWPKSGTSDVAVGHLGKERFLAAIEPWHGNEVVVYRNRRGAWNRDVIDDSLLDAHNVECADLDGDGDDEIVAGFRGKPYGVYIYRWTAGKWSRETLDHGTISAAGCAVADLDGNGKPDIVCIGQATHNLKVWRNLGANK